MSDLSSVTVDLSPREQDLLADLARRRGQEPLRAAADVLTGALNVFERERAEAEARR